MKNVISTAQSCGDIENNNTDPLIDEFNDLKQKGRERKRKEEKGRERGRGGDN